MTRALWDSRKRGPPWCIWEVFWPQDQIIFGFDRVVQSLQIIVHRFTEL